MMIALLWILLAALTGDAALGRSTAVTPDRPLVAGQLCPPALTRLVAATLCGLVLLTTSLYGYAWLAGRFLAGRVHPLLAANLATLLFPVLPLLFGRRPQFRRPQRPQIYYLAVLLLFVWVAWLLGGYPLHQTNGRLAAGLSVFSDYAPHTALVSSFAKGQNIPSDYPHFAGAGLRWHALFYVLCGNLHYLGLPLAWAINLSSAIGTVAAFVLLGTFAEVWSGRRAAFCLAPTLLLLRSSFAVFAWLGSGRLEIRGFIGRQPHDDWGLWTLNVYANQRHFLFGFALALLILLWLLPLLRQGASPTGGWHAPTRWRPLLPAVCLAAALPWWHGSVAVALLMILFVMGLFSYAKFVHLLTALATGIGTVLGGFLFLPIRRPEAWYQTAAALSQAQADYATGWHWGFLATDRSVPGVLAYLVELTGLALPLIIVAAVLCFVRRRADDRWRGLLAASFLLPTLFAFCISLTPDITVNHKYIMMTLMFGSLPIADLLLQLWHVKHQGADARLCGMPAHLPVRLLTRALAVCLALVLTATGMVDLFSYRYMNRGHVEINLDSELTRWLEEETRPREILLTPPWHYHAFFLSGRLSWYGHGYYAWSAGYNTAARHEELLRIWRGEWASWADAYGWFRERGIRYVIVDDSLRSNPEYEVDEAWFEEAGVAVAYFPADQNAVVYRIEG
ncbi:MAG: hypothetical protein QM296_04555 [Bacillota bacterium]|nr:hypothetical protein [Bacillota bacterium]